MGPPPRQAQQPALAGKPQDGLLRWGRGRQEPTRQQVANSKSPVNSSHSLLGNTSVNHIQEDGTGSSTAAAAQGGGEETKSQHSTRGFPRASQVSACCSGGWGGGCEGTQPKKAQHQDKCLREFSLPKRRHEDTRLLNTGKASFWSTWDHPPTFPAPGQQVNTTSPTPQQ